MPFWVWRVKLECDGLTRVISTLMQRDGIHHQVCVGTLTISNVGMIPIHWWIVLSDGRICDYRARMWSREEVQTWFQSQGISIADWAIANGFNAALTREVIKGRRCIRGQSHHIAVALGMKATPNSEDAV